MKQYKSHKIVEAAKIVGIRENGNPDTPTLVLEDNETVDKLPDWHAQHKPEVGGYFVQYADGYQSYSPKEAFESGYTDLLALERKLIDAVKEEAIMKYFAYKHLPPFLQVISRPWCDLALTTLSLPKSAERAVALRKLLEGKDAAVRAALP